MAAKLAQSLGMICTSTGAGRCVAQPTETVEANMIASNDVFMIPVYTIENLWSSPETMAHADQTDHHLFIFPLVCFFDFAEFLMGGITHLFFFLGVVFQI
jgi:hypothetical protein